MAAVQKASPTDWRLAWYRGRALLAQGRTQETLAAFRSMVDELPGELAPKHALGIAYEASGELDAGHSLLRRRLPRRQRLRQRRLPPRPLPGEEGRSRRARWPPTGACPPRRAASARRRWPLARLLVTPEQGRAFPPLDDLVAASLAVESLDGLLDGLEVTELKADLFHMAALCVAGTSGLPKDTKILAVPLREPDLRFAAEETFRACARQATTDEARYALVDRANQVRPLTWT